MTFELIYKLRTKKYWWLDTLLYFTLSVLIATIICYFIFGIKISYQKKNLQSLNEAIGKFATEEQKNLEKKVFEYREKINDFLILLNSHKNPSNLFNFLEKSSLPNIWFNNFDLDVKEARLRINGETEDFQTLAQQIFIFKENKFIKDLKSFSAETREEGKIGFMLIFSLDPQIFAPLENLD